MAITRREQQLIVARFGMIKMAVNVLGSVIERNRDMARALQWSEGGGAAAERVAQAAERVVADEQSAVDET